MHTCNNSEHHTAKLILTQRHSHCITMMWYRLLILICILLQVSYGLTKLLVYLAHSPYGSLSLNDFRRQQFVLVDGDLKLSDIDDVGFLEPKCNSSSQCQQYFSSSNFTLRYIFKLLEFLHCMQSAAVCCFPMVIFSEDEIV